MLFPLIFLGGMLFSRILFGGMPFCPNIFGGNAVPRNDIRTRGNGETVACHYVGLQRNAKSMVRVNSFFLHLATAISVFELEQNNGAWSRFALILFKLHKIW